MQAAFEEAGSIIARPLIEFCGHEASNGDISPDQFDGRYCL